MQDLITNAIGSLKDGPPTGNTVSDCLARFVHHLIGSYMGNVEPWTTEVENLFDALKNRKDPMLKDVSLMNQMALNAAINTLKKLKPPRETPNVKEGT